MNSAHCNLDGGLGDTLPGVLEKAPERHHLLLNIKHEKENKSNKGLNC